MITGERGETTLTRHGLEEYVTDAVIQLDHRVLDQISTRRLRVVKYRGSHHGTNEYPFLIDEDGVSVLPVTSLTLEHAASSERVSSGLPELDAMLGGQGFYRGSTVLVSGTAGTGKTTLAAHFRRRRLPSRRALPVLSLRGVAAADAAEHALVRASISAAGSTTGCCSFTPIARRATGSRRIW